MLFKITEERPIKSLKDIRLKKNQLEVEAHKKSEKINRRSDNILTKTSPQLIYDGILEKFNLQHSLLNMLPLVVKYKQQISDLNLFSKIKKSPKKRFAIIGIGALLAGVTTYLYLNKQNNRE